jgi:hypothetical protein
MGRIESARKKINPSADNSYLITMKKSNYLLRERLRYHNRYRTEAGQPKL